jgi:hypothetical protein
MKFEAHAEHCAGINPNGLNSKQKTLNPKQIQNLKAKSWQDFEFCVFNI